MRRSRTVGRVFGTLEYLESGIDLWHEKGWLNHLISPDDYLLRLMKIAANYDAAIVWGDEHLTEDRVTLRLLSANQVPAARDGGTLANAGKHSTIPSHS